MSKKESKHINTKNNTVHDPTFADQRTQDEIDYFGDQQEIALYKKIASKNKAAVAMSQATNGDKTVQEALLELPGDSEYDITIRKNLKMIAELEQIARGVVTGAMERREALMTLENLKTTYNSNSIYNISKYIADALILKQNTERLKGYLEATDIRGYANAFLKGK